MLGAKDKIKNLGVRSKKIKTNKKSGQIKEQPKAKAILKAYRKNNFN